MTERIQKAISGAASVEVDQGLRRASNGIVAADREHAVEGAQVEGPGRGEHGSGAPDQFPGFLAQFQRPGGWGSWCGRPGPGCRPRWPGGCGSMCGRYVK